MLPQQIQPQVVPIVYIGDKPYKTDNVNHTKTVWTGKNDVQPYPLEKAAALLRFNDVWKLGKADQLANVKVVDSAGAVQAGAKSEKPDVTQADLSKDQATGDQTNAEISRQGPSNPGSRSSRTLE